MASTSSSSVEVVDATSMVDDDTTADVSVGEKATDVVEDPLSGSLVALGPLVALAVSMVDGPNLECVVCDDTEVPVVEVAPVVAAVSGFGAEGQYWRPKFTHLRYCKKCRRPSQPWPSEHCCMKCAKGLVGTEGHGHRCTGPWVWFEDLLDPLMMCMAVRKPGKRPYTVALESPDDWTIGRASARHLGR